VSGAEYALPAHAERDGAKPAVVMGATGETVTYAQLDARSNQVAQLLRAEGLQPGDHVALFLENDARYLEIVWAAQRSGLYYTPISSLLTRSELDYVVGDCGAVALFASGKLAPAAAGIGDRLPDVRVRLAVGGDLDGFEDYDAARDRAPSTPVEPEVAGSEMFYSSGTTGRPKGVRKPLTLEPTWAIPGYFPTYRDLYGFDRGTVWLSTGPLYHAGPLYGCLSAHRAGGTVVVMERFDPAEALRLIERYRVTHAQWVPTMFSRMLKLPPEVRTRHDLSSMRFGVHGAAPCPVAVKQAMLDWWGPILYEFYAGTEGNGMTLISAEEWLARPGSVGRSVLGVAHVVGDDGRELGPGETGTVWFSDGFTFEYHGDPAKTGEAYDDRGWSTLGDVGHLDDAGYLYLTDRQAFMIIAGGVNIYPREIEDVLVVHPKVADVAVIGVPNDDLGEEVKALVQLTDGVEPSAAVEAELVAWCRGRLARVKVPRSIDFVDVLPRLPTGKVQKHKLRAPYWEGRASRLV
jgi:acyl-CoA synthetase (AMP-forming)/AMP-acid ligase II